MIKSAQSSLVDDFSQIGSDELPIVHPPGKLVLGRREAVFEPGRARQVKDDDAERLVPEAALVTPAELGLKVGFRL